MDSGKPEQFLSVKEFGALVGWGDDTIRRLIQRGEIHAVTLPQADPTKKPHRRRRIPKSEVPRFLRRHSNQ
jgi:predicted DNA-binding transcriptional regulator AlpA